MSLLCFGGLFLVTGIIETIIEEFKYYKKRKAWDDWRKRRRRRYFV